MFNNISVFYFELEKINSFFNSNNYVSAIAQELLLSFVEKKYLIPKNKLTISRNYYGKPYFVNYSNLHFNISHSENKIVIALSMMTPIGVDIEKISNPNLKLAKRFFLSEEYNYIISTKFNIIKSLRFYKVWTRKEAYVKYIGKGLSIRLNSFNVLDNSLNYKFKTNLRMNSIISICSKEEAKIFFYHIRKYELNKMMRNIIIN
jgi:4'-phosphopantetheinyl transferase